MTALELRAHEVVAHFQRLLAEGDAIEQVDVDVEAGRFHFNAWTEAGETLTHDLPRSDFGSAKRLDIAIAIADAQRAPSTILRETIN